MSLIGYTFSYCRKEVVEESDAYLAESVTMYKTLKGCVNGLKHYLKDKDLLSEVTWHQNMEIFIKDAEGSSWKDGFEIGWIGRQFWDNHGFYIKCVFIEDDPGEPIEDESEDEFENYNYKEGEDDDSE